jgi:sensor histidine kinase YesM
MKDIQQDFVLLEDEINYINNFIELQKMRLVRSVKLEYVSLANFSALQIAPMLASFPKVCLPCRPPRLKRRE